MKFSLGITLALAADACAGRPLDVPWGDLGIADTTATVDLASADVPQPTQIDTCIAVCPTKVPGAGTACCYSESLLSCLWTDPPGPDFWTRCSCMRQTNNPTLPPSYWYCFSEQ
jgi:hypothetical protein